jgi:hypothetical protein
LQAATKIPKAKSNILCNFILFILIAKRLLVLL